METNYTILICDDEEDIVDALAIYLKSGGYNVLTAHNGNEALALFRKHTVHLVTMDIMMPGMSGIEAMQHIHTMNSRVPVILVTARSSDTDQISGLLGGADDYITKPYNPVVMLAKIRTMLRRVWEAPAVSEQTPGTLRNGGIEIDAKSRETTVDGRVIHLTPTEYDILYLFMTHPGEVFTLAEIYRKIKHAEPFGSESTIAVHIRHLREKVEHNPTAPEYIRVKFGQGYIMEKKG